LAGDTAGNSSTLAYIINQTFVPDASDIGVQNHAAERWMQFPCQRFHGARSTHSPDLVHVEQ
jgi:hypothetical protein